MSANDSQTPQEFCPNCTKAGLPLLPLRYAVARNDAVAKEKAPELVAPFGPGITDIALREDLARYTLRTLRSGYLYVFNEKRGKWSAYEVNEEGSLVEFPYDSKSPPVQSDDDDYKEVCSRHGNPDIGKCIIIPDAHKAGALWLAFSSTAWTAGVRELHARQAYREKHMRRIDIGQWVGGQGTQPHLASLSMLEDRVAEYHHAPPATPEGESENERQARRDRNAHPLAGSDSRPIELEPVVVTARRHPAYDFSLVLFQSSAHSAADFKAEAQQAGERGKVVAGSPGIYPPAMVALDDPTGIAMDLASLMNLRLAEFLERDDIKRPLAVSTLIGSLEEAIRNNAEQERIRYLQQMAVDNLQAWTSVGWDARIPKRSFEQNHEQRLRTDPAYRANWERRVAEAERSALDSLTADDLQRVSDSAWRKYRDKLRDGQPRQWQQQVYQQALEQFDTATIVPLSRAHVAWMKSSSLAAYFECNHDSRDPDSGAAYCDTVLMCIQDTQAIAINMDTYVQWLCAPTVEPDNVLLRALCFNQSTLVTSLSEGTGISRHDSAKLPWDRLLMGYQAAIGHLPDSAQSAPARLLVALGGPVMRALDNALNRGMGPLVVALGLVGRSPVLHTQVRGTLDAAIDHLVNQMVQANPALGNLDRDRLATRMRNQSRGRRQTTRAQGPGMRGMNDFHIITNQLSLGAVTDGMSPAEKLRSAGASVMTFDEWERTPYARWRTLSGANIRAGVVGVLLNLWSLKAAAKDLDDSSPKTRQENDWRYTAAIMATVGAVSEAMHTAIENSRQVGGRLAARINTFWSRALAILGRSLGFAAAVILSFWDGVNSWNAFRRGEAGMGVLYAFSAISSIGAFAALAGWLGPTVIGLSSTGVGIVLAAIAILVGILIMLLQDDKLEAWMRRSYFGTADDRFESQHEEMAELDALLRAEG